MKREPSVPNTVAKGKRCRVNNENNKLAVCSESVENVAVAGVVAVSGVVSAAVSVSGSRNDGDEETNLITRCNKDEPHLGDAICM